MKLTVEFFGLPRRLSGKKETSVEVSDGATVRDVAIALAKQFPAFLGQLILPETYELVGSYFFYNFDAGRAVKEDERVEDGARLLLMFVDAGG